MINKNKQKELVAAAKEVRRNAHAPYSAFHVGASLLTEENEIISGVNVESSSYGLSVCAERNAIASATAKGKDTFLALAIVSKGAVTPCGACRQVIYDICGNIDIILADEEGNIREVTNIKTLLPEAFGDKDLE
ncbi:MAG: cytidine deaminase [Candidatus Marinimicrobia bacterium]|nr:cytidine deaminase [Candidatus Neomarinimicrobiota bacterium]